MIDSKIDVYVYRRGRSNRPGSITTADGDGWLGAAEGRHPVGRHQPSWYAFLLFFSSFFSPFLFFSYK